MCSSEKAKDKYCKFNSALNKREYTQPWDEYYSKIAGSTAVLITMVSMYIAIISYKQHFLLYFSIEY